MNERDRLIEQLIRERGGTREQYLHFLNSVAYHESGGSFDPKQEQIGGGPGVGKYQFEKGNSKGARTAANRAKNYYKQLGYKIPNWLSKLDGKDSVDVSNLSSEQQDVLFLANLRKHPKADFRNLWEGKETVPEFWANYHWAGDSKDRPKRLRSFNKHYKAYNQAQQAVKEAPKQNLTERPEQPKDAVNIKQPEVIDELINKYSGNLMESLNTRNIAAMGGMVGTGFKDKELNSYNAGGKHETNPYGGILQGMGSNGKPNTVEQGEAAYVFNGKDKFIFSDRVNVAAEGGLIDPPNKKAVVDENKQWVKDWFSAPETLARYSMNTSQGFSKSIPDLQKGLKNLDSVKYQFDQPTEKESSGAMYSEPRKTIDFYKDPTNEIATHELTHATGLDDTLSGVIKDKWGLPAAAIQKKHGTDFTGAIEKEFELKGGNYFGDSDINDIKTHSRYMSTDGELYPRIMEMRRVLGAKPGQEIKDEDIQYIKKNIKNNDMFKFYTDEQIKEMLNTLAANKSNKNYDNLV